MAENVYLLEIEPGHRIDGDGWEQDASLYMADPSGNEIEEYDP